MQGNQSEMGYISNICHDLGRQLAVCSQHHTLVITMSSIQDRKLTPSPSLGDGGSLAQPSAPATSVQGIELML